LIDNGFHARRRGRNVLRGKASRVIGHLARKSDDSVFGDDIYGGRFKKRLGIKFGLNAGGDRVIAGLVASEREEQEKRKCREEQFPSKHKASQNFRRQKRYITLREFPQAGHPVGCRAATTDNTLPE